MSARRVVAVVPDLFFATRIAETAKTLGIEVEMVPVASALAACRRVPPALVVLDLHAAGDPLALARALAADPATRGVPTVGFYSHVDAGLREAALAAGVGQVLPRSAFTAKLAAILAGPEP